MTTIIYNGIEMAQKKGGTVEIFCDRPSVVSITELIATLTLLDQTSGEAQISCHSSQSPYSLRAESDHRPEPGATR
jgi:hypothetical protein